MSKESRFNLRQILLLATLLLSFLGFAIIPLLQLFNSSNSPSVSPNSRISKAELVKKLELQEKSYQKILEREPKNQFALQNVIDSRLKMYQVTGNIEMLQKSVAPMDELIKQNPKNQTMLALKKEIELLISKEGTKPKP